MRYFRSHTPGPLATREDDDVHHVAKTGYYSTPYFFRLYPALSKTTEILDL